MRKLIECTHVSLGGEIGSPQEWAFPYLDDDHMAYASELLGSADALLLGRVTYEGLCNAYPKMEPTPFVDRMNTIPKYVASRTLRAATWNATVIEGDVGDCVTDLKSQPGGNLLKYGTGRLDDTLLARHLVDEFHFLMTPAAVGRGLHLFEEMETSPLLTLQDVRRFASGVVVLVYQPRTGF